MRLGALALVLVLFVPPLGTEAQQAGKVHRIGFLRASTRPESYIEAFRQGLRDRGYVEGHNFALEYRWAGGRTDRLPDLAAGRSPIVGGTNYAPADSESGGFCEPFRAAAKERANGLLVRLTPLTSPADRKGIVDLAGQGAAVLFGGGGY